MNFSQYYAQISAAVFPEGEAENLVHVHKLAVKDALIDIQTKIPCLRTNHADYVGQSSTLFHCGASTFDTVDGNIERIYTSALDGGCDPVEAMFVDHERMLDMIHSYRCCLAGDAYGMTPRAPNDAVGAPVYAPGSASTDKGYRTGPDALYWSINRGTVYVFPSIESTEQIVVEWNGIQRTFIDTTVIPVTFESRDVMNAVEVYLDAQVARRETKDMSDYQTANSLYTSAISQLVYDCRKAQQAVRSPKVMPPDVC